MITELEQEFFKVFGIKPYCVRSCTACYLEQGIDAWEKFNCENTDCDKCEHDKSIWEYPEITDRKLLNMICLIADICNYSGDVFDIEQNSINELKKFILHFLINYMKTEHTDTFYKNDEVKICVQQLFKEGKHDN